MSAVPPLAREDLSQFEPLFQAVEQANGFVPNSLFALGRKPDILKAFMDLFVAAVQSPGETTVALRHMVSHIASRAAGCFYCQAHTAHSAISAGVDEAKMAEIWTYDRSDKFTDAERAALAFAQAAAVVPNAVSDAHREAVRAHFSAQGVAEILAVVAVFGFLNRWNDSLATELEDAPLALAKRTLGPAGWAPGKHRDEG